ncbi:MAG: PocR ligand-binding domain-containing protein [Sphaerochaetaceae bacterium]|jgi:YesN/AraC family two-component response regulator|nr:PocR ligand-binding domain-containing protein [Sphaerochaetaceae bacterium]MDD3366936.1 PocR ligand-binding domain-containing protein [Sphaerochaetaceae bacterium]MDD4219140.1 PocR ligand-binding domain-containing protein [Sphaerochaetaceae bacterium]
MEVVLANQQILSLKDLSILEDVRRLFYETTNLGLSFYYTGSKSYDFYPPNEKNSYCRLVQSFLGMEPCVKSDLEALGRATRSSDYCLYTCHAGLLNIAVPLSFKGEILGAMFTGQLVTEPHSRETFNRMVEKMPLTEGQKRILYNRYLQVKHFDKDQLLLATKLIVFMSNYIISRENEIFLQSEVFKKEERILQFENERMRMRNNLQKLSISVLKDRVNQQSDVTKHSYKTDRKILVVRRAEELIQKYFAQPLTLEDVAKAVYLSPNYFSAIFKEINRTTFTNFLNEIRVKEGKRLLKETDMPIKEIVPLVGFNNYDYFNKVFKKIAGLPPAAFREMQRTTPKSL